MTEQFKSEMLLKRESFVEKIHAAFVLNTSLNHWGPIGDGNLQWLIQAYPGTKIEKGTDQGGKYNTITPNF